MSVRNLSSIELIFLSNFSNTIEVTLQHPLFVLKNHIQYNKKIYYNFRYLFKGYLFNLYSLNLITCFQYVSYGYLYKKTKKDIESSITSGILSGFIASPFELCSIHKKMNETLLDTIYRKDIYKRIYIGLIPTLFREGIYSVGLLTLTPKIENLIESKYNYIYSPIISGLLCTILSHPFDTIKTYQQYHKKKIYPKMNSLFNGLLYRSIRLINSFFIINECNKLYLKLK